MYRTRDKNSTLYMVPLTTKQNENMTECKILEHHFAGSVYEKKSKSDLSTFLHLACWSPCISTITTAIKSNLLSTWPGLTKQLVPKYLPKSEATAKGHIRESFKGKQSTQPREPSETPVTTHLSPTNQSMHPAFSPVTIQAIRPTMIYTTQLALKLFISRQPI